MFHKSNLGLACANLPHDLDGFVPEASDKPEAFRWDGLAEPWTEEAWAAYVARAVAETDAAKAALDAWRAEGGE